MAKEYEVGYKKPPVAHQFKKGQSGNPAGRARKSKKVLGGHPFDSSLQEMWLEEADKEVVVNINGRPARRTMGRLAIERILADAAAGKPTAQRIVHAKLSEVERVRRERWIESVDVSASLWRKAKAELEERLAAGEVDPLVIPHPDDFVFNKETNMVELLGPIDEEQHKAMIGLTKLCKGLVERLESQKFKEARDPGRLGLIRDLCKWNSVLPPRLKQWPKARFAEDLEGLFPDEFVTKWAFDQIEARLRD